VTPVPISRVSNAAMVAAMQLRCAILAAVWATASGFAGLRLPTWEQPVTKKDADGSHSDISMLAADSEMQRRSGQSAAWNPFCWLLECTVADAPDNAAPTQMIANKWAPNSPTMGIPTLGIMAMAPAAAGLAARGLVPPGAIPLSALVPTPAPAAGPPPAAAQHEVAAMRNEITALREEVTSSHKDMWNAVKLITSTIEKDETNAKALAQDVQMLHGRPSGSVALVADECSIRQSSCGDCIAVPTCVWCKVEQRCFSGNTAEAQQAKMTRHMVGSGTISTCDR